MTPTKLADDSTIINQNEMDVFEEVDNVDILKDTRLHTRYRFIKIGSCI